MATFKIAALSDLHIDTERAPASWELARRALAAAKDEQVDHVVIAGDLFDCATAMKRDRAVVKRELKRLGLWHRDLLTIVFGNHDIFHTAHHGTRLQQAREVTRAAGRSAQKNMDLFSDWVDDLVGKDDRVSEPFPFSKRIGHVRLTGLDTTESTTAQSANARFDIDAARFLMAMADDARHVLVVHNAPFEGRETVANSFLGCAGGYSARDHRRFDQACEKGQVRAVLCGHVHATDSYAWKLPSGVPVKLVGRTGGLHGTPPTLGVLSVPEKGALKWREVQFS